MGSFRIRYTVSRVPGEKGWQAANVAATTKFKTQAEAVAYAAKACRDLWAGGQPAELMIQGRDGRIRDNRTYGRDPASTKG